MEGSLPVLIAAVVILALIGLAGFTVDRLSKKPTTARLITRTIIAIALLAGALPAIIAAFSHG